PPSYYEGRFENGAPFAFVQGKSDQGCVDSFTSSTPSSIFCTVGCNSFRISCSSRDRSSMLRACCCNSLSTAFCLSEIRCIHQKQTPQQTMSTNVKKFARVRPIPSESSLGMQLAGRCQFSATLYDRGKRHECR